MPTTYQITIPDSVEWSETQSIQPPYRQLKAKLSIYTLYLDLVRSDDGESMEWNPTIYDDIVDADVYTSFDDDHCWSEDELETAKEEILDEALNLLHAYLVDDFDAVEISDDSIDIDSLDLEN